MQITVDDKYPVYKRTIFTSILLLIFGVLLIFPTLASSASLKTYKENNENIIVKVRDGAFYPDVIGIPVNKVSKVVFDIGDDKLCKKKIIFKGLNLELPITIGKKSSIKLNIKKPGKYHIECESGAFCGVLFVLGDSNKQPQHIYSPDSK